MYISSQPDPLRALSDDKLVDSLPGRAEKSWRRIAERIETVRDLRMEPPGKAIEAVLKAGYKDHVRGEWDNASDRIDDLEQLADYAHAFPDLDRFLGEISLLTNVSGKGTLVGDNRDDYVTLSSVHQAKGLEWPVVFMLSVAEDQFPHKRAVQEGDIDEERRLFYVAVTRARDELYLCQPVRASSRGRMEIQRASQFIRELRQQMPEEEYPWEKWVVEE
jgi:DNA helicase-2/ATP-dependent DNA helicase PcrA